MFCGKDPMRITKKDIRDYMDYLSEKGKSGSTLNVHLAALKFFIREVLSKDWKINIRCSRTPKRLPVVLSKREVIRLLDAISNRKHRLMISLIYASGLRLSEAIMLKAGDIDLDNNLGWVRGGKGNKDRMFVIARKMKKELGERISTSQQDSYIFKGNNGPVSRKTIYDLVRRYSRKAGIRKKVHPHTLRHSFATHLIEDNHNIELVQRLLGHDSPETTRTYIHTSLPRRIYVESPYDTLNIEK